jgi:CubicO group peptidase (beta-lactamase class C family)
LQQQLHAYLQQQERRGFSGAVVVARGAEILLEQGYGLAIRDTGIPNTPETVFDIGSITKPFTAAAILKLEMQGLLQVSDPITSFFANVPADKAEITVEQLLTHTAGFPDAIGGDYEPLSRDQLLQEALGSPLRSSPGARYSYSNVGYSLLGAIIEVASDQSYEQYLADNLWHPAGMEWTGYLQPNWEERTVAHGYWRRFLFGSPLEQRWDDDGPYWNLRANGGLLSTSGDMLRWHQALLGDQILSEEAKSRMFAPQVSEGGDSFAGYGWSIIETENGTLITHNGSNGYFFADFLRYVDEEVVIFLASNSGLTFRALNMGQTLANIVLDS